MFHLVTQWGQIPSWKMKWGVDGGFHFFFFWGTAEAKSRRQIFTYTVKCWSKSRISLIFFPSCLDWHTYCIKVYYHYYSWEEFISAPLGFSWLDTGEDYERELLWGVGGVNKSTICIRTTLWLWNQLLWCIEWRKAQYHPKQSKNSFCPFPFPACLPQLSSYFSVTESSLHEYSTFLLCKPVTRSRYRTSIFQYADLHRRTCLHHV